MPIDYESWRVATTGGFLRRVDEMLEDPLAPPQITAISGGTIHRSLDVHDDVATVNGQVLAWDAAISQYKVRTVKDIYESQSDGQTGFTTDASGIVLRGGKRIKFNDDDASAGLSLQAASTMASDVTLTLPSTAPAGNQILRSNLSTPTTLEWADSNRRSTREFLVTSYGAVCDGVTDDAPAILAALTACGNDGIITFPPGKTLKINQTIVVSNGGVWLEGNGCKLVKSIQMDMIYVSGSYNVIRDFVLDGGNSNWTGIFLVGSFNRALNNRIYDCGSYGNPGHGIGIGKDDGTCTRNIVMGNHISHCGEVGIAQNKAKESIIVDNTVETCGAEGITIDVASDRGLVAHNVIKGCCAAGGVGGIGIDQVTMVSVIGNLIQDTGGSLPGIKFQNNIGPTTLVTVMGNRLTGNVGGIHLSKNTGTGYATNYCHIGGNVIYSGLASSYGVKIDADCLFNKVLANQISVVTDSVANNGSQTLLDSIPAIPGNRALITNSGGTDVEWSGMGFNGTNAIASCLAMLGGTVSTGGYKIVIGPSNHDGNVNNVTLISPTAITTSGGNVSAYNIVGIGCASLIGNNNVVVGHGSSAGNHSSTVVGTFCSASTYFGTALGHWSSADDYGIAIGTSDTGNATGQTLASTKAIAIGKSAKAGETSIAIGPDTRSTNSTVAIGDRVDNVPAFAYPQVIDRGVLIGAGVTCRPYGGSQVLLPVIIGGDCCRGRQVGTGTCVIGGLSAASNTNGADSGYYIRDSTILGYDMVRNYEGNLDGKLRIGANGRELVGGKMPTYAYDYDTGGAQGTTGNGVFDIFGRIRLHTNNRAHILEGEFVGNTDPLTQPCIRWRTYNVTAPDTVVHTYDLNLF